MTIQALIEKALKRLEREGKLLTPDFYAEAFCAEAQLASTSVEDCMHVERFKQTLNKEFQKELERYRIKSVSELVRFLISKLNRTNPTKNAEILEANLDLSKKILSVVSLLHNKEASELAKRTTELLESNPSPTQIDQFRQLWSNFASEYDDTYLQLLAPLGEIDQHDLKKSIEGLQTHHGSGKNGCAQEELERIARLLVASFVPSIAAVADAQIEMLGKKIETTPASLLEASIEDEVKNAISLRIALDKESLGTMILSLEGVVAKLSSSLIEMIEKSDNSTVAIQKIKAELEGYGEENILDFKVAHTKLFKIAVALEENTKLLSNELKTHSTQVKIMGAKIQELENELKKAKEESKEDYLTKLYNKRALQEFLQIRESAYERFGHNYALVFFDLDHFKKINDTYGHEAGDAVLAAFGRILKKECRIIDVVGRYGGEEFIAILGDTSKEGAAVFAEKIRAQVQRTRFMFRGSRIEVTVSCGVEERDGVSSLKQLLSGADSNLYKAKHNGRNRVEA